ncbi:Signal recognition particle subunit SRP68 [Yarrowia sp. C11]|nr:Signal recognition particle subunit SRP68 [Yarrowia sp. C11]
MENPLLTVLSHRTAGNEYRGVVTKRLATLKRRLGVQTKDTKQYQPKEVAATDVAEDIRFAQLLLLQAERAWAVSQETASVLETNGSAGKRKRVASKLTKAVQYAVALEQSVSVSQSDEVRLQIATYRLLLEGALYAHKKQWQKLVEPYSAARVGLSALVTLAKDAEDAELLADVISTQIDPALGVALLKVSPDRKLDLENASKGYVDASSDFGKLVQKINPHALEVDEAHGLDEIEWRGHQAKITDPDVARTVSNALTQSKAEDKTIADYDTLLSLWQSANDLVKEELERFELAGIAAHDDTTQNAHIVLTFINFHMLQQRIERDRLLLSEVSQLKTVDRKDHAKSKQEKLPSALKISTHTRLLQLKDSVRLLGNIVQSVDEILNLAGVSNDSALVAALGATRDAYRAQKLASIGASYDLVGDYKNALALSNKALQLQQTVGDADHAAVTGIPVPQNSQLTANTARLQALETIAQRLSEKPLNHPVSDNMDSYPMATAHDTAHNIVEFDQRLKPVLVKPVFFDIAYNYVQYPAGEVTESGKSGKVVEEEQKTKKSGFLGGLFRK